MAAEHRLFFAQLEAAETIIFLTEARRDFLQGIDDSVRRAERTAEGGAATGLPPLRLQDGDGLPARRP